MNVDRGKTAFTPEEEAELQGRLLKYKKDNGYTWSTVSARTGVPEGTVSSWAGGTYNQGKGSQETCVKIWRFFLHDEAQEELAKDAPIAPAFQKTQTSQRITGQLYWAQRGNFVIITGDPGVGKSASLRQYAETSPNCFLITASPSMGASLHSCMMMILRAMNLARTGGGARMLSEIVRQRLANRQALLIFDEAQWLSARQLEELRAIHDATGCGLVLAGNREVLTRIDGGRTAEFAQLYSRVSSRLVIETPTTADVAVMLGAWGVTDPKEQGFLSGIALRTGGGGLRSLGKVLEYATIAAQGDSEPRILDHLKEAWAALSSRVAA